MLGISFEDSAVALVPPLTFLFCCIAAEGREQTEAWSPAVWPALLDCSSDSLYIKRSVRQPSLSRLVSLKGINPKWVNRRDAARSASLIRVRALKAINQEP